MPTARSASVVPIDAGRHRERFIEHRNALVMAHLWLVPPIAGRIHKTLPTAFELEDLLGWGHFGLVRAATRYRRYHHGGTPFSVFARPRIRGAILDSVRRKAWEENTRDDAPAGAEPAYAPDLDGPLDTGRLSKRVALAMRRLTGRERMVLGALYAENCETVAEAAHLLGLTIVQVTAEHDAAVLKLRAQLAA